MATHHYWAKETLFCDVCLSCQLEIRLKTVTKFFQQKLHFCLQEVALSRNFVVDFCKICNYQSHPFLLWKRSNVV